jgi:hypothetical protein
VPAGRKKKADTELILALACGSSPESAATKARVSPRTVYRRLADPAFRAQVNRVRADLVQRAAGLLTAVGMGAIKTLATLHESASSEAIRLEAAKAILDRGCKLREAVEIVERLSALEAQAGLSELGQRPA